MYSGQPRAGFMMQDCEVVKGVMATLRNGGGNVGTRGHNAGHLSFPI